MGAIKGCRWFYRATDTGYEGKRVNPGQPLPDDTWTEGRRPLTEVEKDRLRTANTGRVMGPEWRAKMSAASKGKPKSEAHKAAMSAAVSGKPRPWRRKGASDESI
jgi:hypothetical protein